MNPIARFKVSVLFFFQFFIWGSWGATMGIWMSKHGADAGFNNVAIGQAFATTSIAAIISPFFVGMIADRFFSAQRVLGFLHVVGGVLLYLASQQTTFTGFYPLLLAHTLCYMPTLALANTVAFSQMDDSAKHFGSIRVLGTFGWIAAGLMVGKLGLEPTAQQFLYAAYVSVALGVYSFLFLPNVPPRAKGEPISLGAILGLDALQMMKDRSFFIFSMGSFLICIPLAFYYSGAGLFLGEIGVKEVGFKMTFGQMSEVLFMLLFPLMFARLGVKKMLLLGMLCWTIRYVCFAAGAENVVMPLLLAGIILHGPCFDFFFVTGQIYVDQQADRRIRSAAQGFIAFLTYGVGMYVGSTIQGYVIEHYKIVDAAGVVTHNWKPTWLIPAAAAGVVMLIFLAMFDDPKKKQVA